MELKIQYTGVSGDLERISFVDIARDLDIPRGDEVPGVPLGTNISWEPSHIMAVAEKIKDMPISGKTAAFIGHVSSWMLAAAAAAASPNPVAMLMSDEEVADIKSKFEIVELDPCQHIPKPPVGKLVPEGRLDLIIEEETDDRIYIRFVVDTSDGGSSHSYSAKNLLHLVLPEISSGKDLFIYGSGPNIIPAAICLGYMDTARSISFRYHSDPFFACAVSKTPDRPLGYAEILSEEDSKRFSDGEGPPEGMPESETQSFPRPAVFDSIAWPAKYYLLEGTYKVMMPDHMPGGTAEYNTEVPVATAEFKAKDGSLTGIYMEPGREPVELEKVYCDGLTCGWIHPKMGREGTDVFKFELTMHHGNILLGNCGADYKPSPVICIQIEGIDGPVRAGQVHAPEELPGGVLPPSPIDEDIEQPNFPRDKCFDEIVWRDTFYTLEGPYRVMMLDHMPGGTAGYNTEVPVSVARFETANGKLTGVYDEPGREPVELEDVFCDGLSCGWIHPKTGREGTDVFKYELTMHHGNILLGNCGADFKPSPIACIQIKE